MAGKQDFNINQGRNFDRNLLKSLYNNLRLIVRLLRDPRVNGLLKILPIGALLYLLVPTDIFPINPLDDALVIWLGGHLFIDLCPEEIVEEHRKALGQSAKADQKAKDSKQDVVDGTYREVSSEDK